MSSPIFYVTVKRELVKLNFRLPKKLFLVFEKASCIIIIIIIRSDYPYSNWTRNKIVHMSRCDYLKPNKKRKY